MSDPIFVDVNVVMYAVGAEHPYRRPCLDSLDRIVNDELPAVVSSEIHQEILHRYLRDVNASSHRLMVLRSVNASFT